MPDRMTDEEFETTSGGWTSPAALLAECARARAAEAALAADVARLRAGLRAAQGRFGEIQGLAQRGSLGRIEALAIHGLDAIADAVLPEKEPATDA